LFKGKACEKQLVVAMCHLGKIMASEEGDKVHSRKAVVD
jgi:hypothetical protein